MIALARVAALDALTRIEGGGVDLGAAVDVARRGLDDPRDLALMLELTAGTLRMRAAVDHQLALRLHRPLAGLDPVVLQVLRLGAYQLIYLSKTRDAAIVNDAVAMTRRGGVSSAAGMVNAVLRGIARERTRLVWPDRPAGIGSAADRDALVLYLATVHSHPAWLVSRWIERHGADAAEQWLAFDNLAPALTLAPNRLRIGRDDLRVRLEAEGVATHPTATSPHGLIVDEGHPLTGAAFRDGLFVVQDEASQMIAEVAAVAPGEHVLDLCAAPGGKTLALAAAAGSTGRVIACDVRRRRVRVLAATMARCGATDVGIVIVPASGGLPFRDGAFDLILVDAPCSGLGTLRRDPDIRWRRTPADFDQLAAAQGALLDRVAALASPGGRIVYSTCSSEPEENDDVVAAFLSRHPGFAMTRRWQTLPFRDRLEAFFAAVLARNV